MSSKTKTTNSQEPDAKSGKITSYQTKMEENQNGTDILKKKRQKPDAKSQMPRASRQEPDAKVTWDRNLRKAKFKWDIPGINT